MNCSGGFLYNEFLMKEIAQYLSYKKAKTCKEKEFHSSVFIRGNGERFEKEFCRQQCPFKENCKQKKGE